MLLAAELAMLDIDTLVLEANAAPVEQPRAGTMHGRTVQSLVRRGFVEVDSAADPAAAHTMDYPYAGVPGLVVTAPATEGPPILSIPQVELERRFEARARAVGARVLREHRVTAIAQDGAGVRVAAAGPDGERTVAAQYLVGADGGRSVVREQAGFARVSHPATLDCLIAIAPVLNPDAAPIGWNRTSRGWTRIDLDWGGRTRVITVDFGGPAADRHAPVTREELEATFARIAGARVELGEPDFLGRFSDYSRLATEYRRGRILLAGDAAHVHFPIGGQGLNLGIQDAVNLGWKLAAAVRRPAAREALLDSYHAERHPQAQRVLDSTRAQVELMRRDPAEDPLAKLFGELYALAPVARHLGSRVSGQDIRYGRDGVTAGEFQTNVRLQVQGESTSIAELLRAGRPLLVALSGDRAAKAGDGAAAAEPWASDVRIVVARPEHPLPWRSALIRPDGYLAWTATADDCDTEQLAQVLTGWFGSGQSAGRRGPARAGRTR
jgi:2-polyprenyl-6-methoxyphenol hydroxylase-like FAD-dependent oxidoreductase